MKGFYCKDSKMTSCAVGRSWSPGQFSKLLERAELERELDFVDYMLNFDAFERRRRRCERLETEFGRSLLRSHSVKMDRRPSGC